jgi:hypothetical protein
MTGSAFSGYSNGLIPHLPCQRYERREKPADKAEQKE